MPTPVFEHERVIARGGPSGGLWMVTLDLGGGAVWARFPGGGDTAPMDPLEARGFAAALVCAAREGEKIQARRSRKP